MILVGEGQLREEIEIEVHRRNISKQVLFIGNVGNVNEYMMAMDILVFPSLFEGFPVTLLEAQATGLYCIISDTITDEVVLTEQVRMLSLDAGIENWAKVAQNIPEVDRVKSNKYISDSEFNMDNSIENLMLLYDQMKEQ